MTEFGGNVQTTIGDYIRQNVTLKEMKDIHRRFTGENKDFGRWENVEKQYLKMEWDQERYTEFLEISRDVVEEDVTEISEAYLDILEPEEITVETIVNSLDPYKASDRSSPTREGFRYTKRSDDLVTANYYYYTSDVDISEGPKLEEIPNPKRIGMRFIPSIRLVVIETTQPAMVGKVKSVLNDKTMLDVAVTGNLNLIPDQAEETIQSFMAEYTPEDN